MPQLPSIQKDSINVTGGSVNITQEQAANADGGLGRAASFVSNIAQDYFIDEKVKFDRVRLIEAQNVMEAHKTRLQLDEKEGYQNKLGENAILFKDDDGRDFLTSYTERYRSAAEDTITQLQLTPDQQTVFRKMVDQDSQNWTEQLRRHQVNQGFKYKESVLNNTAELAARKAMGSYQDIEALNESLTTGNAAISELGEQFGWSAAEVTNKKAEYYAGIHNANLQQIIKDENFTLAESYLNQYSAQIPEINRHAYASAINDLKEDYAANQLINNINLGVSPGSNPAFNSSDPTLLKQLSGSIKPYELPTLRYNDIRLDAKNEVIGRELGMDWAKPILTAIRVAGEKSNNNQVSGANAKGVMQFTPIAIEQVRRITGKKIDPTNPDEAIWGAYKFVDWISKKYNTKDPNIIASYYNGGGQYVGQLKKGGANAISNAENRNYVKRINSFLSGSGYSDYINRSMIGDQLDPNLLAGLSPKAQSKVISAHRAALKQKEDAKKQQSENFYEAVIDSIDNGGVTSLADIDTEGKRLLTASQQKNIESTLKAKNLGEYNNDVYLNYLTNPSILIGMKNADFKQLLSVIPPDARDNVAKEYAKANNRTITDAEKAKQGGAPKTSLVTPENITKVLNRNASAIGFGAAPKGSNKIASKATQKGSAFWIATINDLTARTRELERRQGRNLTSAQIDNVVNSYLDNALIKQNGEVKGQVYSPTTFKRSDVPKPVEQYIFNSVRGQGYTDIDKVPDSVYMKYYFQWYRRRS